MSNINENVVILHCDMDAFYAQVEQVRLRLSVSTPIVVQQWHSLIATNYAARDHGIKRGQSVSLARSMCPNLVAVHVPTYRLGEDDLLSSSSTASNNGYSNGGPSTGGKYRSVHKRDECKVSLASYRNASRRVFEVLTQFGQVEKASIDEAYIAVSVSADQLPDEDECRNVLGCGVHLAGGRQQDINEFTERDRQLIQGVIKAQKIRQRVLEVCNYTISIGVARTKSVAKLLSSMHKPDKCSVIFDDDLMTFMTEVPFQKIGSLGGKFGSDILKQILSGQSSHNAPASTSTAILDPLGSDGDNDEDNTHSLVMSSIDSNVKCKDLFHVSRERFAEIGAAEVFDIIRGQYHQPIEPKSHLKSMLSAKTFSANQAVSFELAQKWLALLTRELWERISEEYEMSRRWPRSLSLQGQLEGGKVVVGKMFSVGRLNSQLELFNKLSKHISKDSWKTYIRRLTVSATNFTTDRDISEIFQSMPASSKPVNRTANVNIEKVMNGNYHESEWQRVDVLSKKLDADSVPAIFQCERCLQILFKEQLHEHVDYHVALKLYKQDNPSGRPDVIKKKDDDNVIVISSSSDDEDKSRSNNKGKRKSSNEVSGSLKDKKRQLTLKELFSK